MSESESNNPGSILKAQREKLGLSINDISLATKISPRILRALEAGETEALPPKSFVRGFIRSYANYMKLDAKALIESYEQTEPTTTTSDQEDSAAPEIKPQRTDVAKIERQSTASNILIISIIIILVVLIFGIKKVVDRYQQERVVPSPEQVQNMSGTPLNPEPTPAAEDEAANDEAAPAAEVTATPTPTVTATPTPTTTPSPTPVATPTPTAAPTPTPTPSPTPAPTAAPTPTPSVAAPKAVKPQEVIIEALDQVEVTLRIDGGSAQKIRLKPEAVHTIKAKKDVALEISDGGLVNIIHNGSDRGNPGTLGKPAKVAYP